MNIGERIHRWRSSRPGLTQSALAKKLGVSKQAVYLWERAGRDKERGSEPTHEHVAAVAEAIGISLSVFYGPPPETTRRRRRAS